eukprot:scaffold132053_cov69-Phaeocystis_antarctica.AAC.2
MSHLSLRTVEELDYWCDVLSVRKYEILCTQCRCFETYGVGERCTLKPYAVKSKSVCTRARATLHTQSNNSNMYARTLSAVRAMHVLLYHAQLPHPLANLLLHGRLVLGVTSCPHLLHECLPLLDLRRDLRVQLRRPGAQFGRRLGGGGRLCCAELAAVGVDIL